MLIALLLLLVFIIATRYIPVFSFLNFANLSDENFKNLLTALEVLLAIVLATLKYLKDRKEDKKLTFCFKTDNSFLSLNTPQIFDTLITNLMYYPKINTLNNEPIYCYGLNIKYSKANIYNSVRIPLLIKSKGNLKINNLKFLNFYIYLVQENKINKKYGCIRKFIVKASNVGNSFLGIDIFCNRNDEKELLNGRFIIMAKTKAYTENGRSIKKYIIIHNQCINGINNIYDFSQCRSYIIFLFIKLKYKFFGKQTKESLIN